MSVAGLGIVSDGRLAGIGLAGGHVRSGQIRGVSTPAWIRADEDLRGLTIAGYNQIRGVQQGLAIGLYNSAEVLQGVQVGLLNRVKNNKPPFRWLPLINLNLD